MARARAQIPPEAYGVGLNVLEPTPLPDTDLVDAANRGDAAAMRALYFRYRDWVYGQAIRMVGTHDDAIDVVQEAFIYFFGKFPRLTLTSQIKTFLYPVVRNLSLNVLTARRKVVSLGGHDVEKIPNGRSSGSNRHEFDDLIKGLGEDEQEILILRFVEEFSLKEIAETLSIPLGTVKSRLHRALAHVRPLLTGQ
ncbi:RNA polymerase sigma factor [Candidatus Fermentibacteria bacterium]|nr:RNA polymerase sigma factor [Candidatus Fermentibacteria bacterium]